MALYSKVPELSVSSVFKLRPEELELFFYREHSKMPDNRGERREALVILEKVDWKDGLMNALMTDAETGIIGDVKDIQRRQKFFGKNKRSLPTVRSFWAILWDQFDEIYMQVLLGLGIACLVLAFFSKAVAWVDSASIIFAVLFAGLIQTFCDWGKEKQFLLLQKEIQNDKTVVLRGARGTSQIVYNRDLVVGDVILLSQGDRAPADCMLIQEMDMKVDQKDLFPDELNAEMADKQCSANDATSDIERNPDMVLFQDSMVMKGSGKALVLAVGAHTLKEREIAAEVDQDKHALRIEKELTPFQQKLETLAKIIGAYAKLICIVSILLFAVVWFLHVLVGDNRLVDEVSIKNAIDLACTIAALLAVCIPEGMPLVISMAMAFGVQSLQAQNLLIKNLASLETSGQLHEIITGKTATLTEGELNVEVVHSQGRTHTDVKSLEAMTTGVLNQLKEAIVLNTDANLQMTDDSYKPTGSPVEVGLLHFANEHGECVHDAFQDREDESKFQLKAFIPFSSDRKVMTVAYIDHNYDSDKIKVYIKGAPEEIVKRSTQYFNHLGAEEDIDREAVISKIENEIILHETDGGQSGLKALSFGTKEIDARDFQEGLDFEVEENREWLERGLTYIATVGMSDPLRDGVADTIEALNETSTNVRLLSGDHKLAVLSCAVALNMKETIEDVDDTMDGAELLELLKSKMDMKQDEDEGRGATWVFKNPESRTWFRKMVKKKICFVYRATPQLKHMFTAAMRNSDAIVGVTGEGLSDARALSEANVGFSMGMDGCDAAKDHSDIIMMDDRFSTLSNAIRFGRNVQDNVRKFVQYQLTVNLVTMVFVILTTCIIGHAPFNVVQLLWTNLIMDVLAAIAYSTETPPNHIKGDRITAKDRIITKPMMRQILFQSLYQIIVMFTLLGVAPIVGGYEYNLFNAPSNTDLKTTSLFTYRIYHQTFMFQCFIVMNLFNMINCRILDPMPPKDSELEDESLTEEDRAEIIAASKPSFNIFTRFWGNLWFWIVFFLEWNVQLLIVGYQGTGFFFSTCPLSFGMHMTAIGLGLGSWAVGALIRCTGPGLIKAMPEIGEDAEALDVATKFSEKRLKAVTFDSDEGEQTIGEDRINDSYESGGSHHSQDDEYTAGH